MMKKIRTTAASAKQGNPTQLKKISARSWVEASFQKRECSRFHPTAKEPQRCACGQSYQLHSSSAVGEAKLREQRDSPSQRDSWSSSRDTTTSPTDAYGTIEFQGGPHPNKAQYVRLSYDTRPELILQLFTREWGLELPKLLITVQGGKANFELQPKLKKVLRKGLLRAAKTTGAWVFTGGTNTGVTRQVGDALVLERTQSQSQLRGGGRVVSIGIAPWGIVENNHELIGRNRDVPYHSISSPRSKLTVLNNRHAYFLLVDNGTAGRYGAEIILRRKLEKYISIQKLHPCTHCCTPVVCLVIEGGTNTIRAVLEYVTDNPPVPVVVCDGSGRAADLIAFTHKYASETGEQTVLESMKEYLLSTIRRTFEVGDEQAECLYYELLECTRRKNLITVFRISDRAENQSQELDQTILTALFKSQHLSPSEQLSLALAWNRVDIARSEIFVYGQEWPPGALDEAMMQALEHDRIDFVKLLLENGVSMKKFLTIPRLEDLYNTRQGPSNTLGYVLRDIRPHIPRGYVWTLHDIGLVINKLMGGAFRHPYTRRKFKTVYALVMKKSNSFQRSSASCMRYYVQPPGFTINLLADKLPGPQEVPLFEYPFNELVIWAVLTKRQEMAVLMWQHGEEALAKALVACKLYKAMAHEAAEDDLETEIYEELKGYARHFEDIAVELLDYCYREDADQTPQLLTCELQNWSGQTCLSLAVTANHRNLLAHPCSQIILADLWMGGLRTRKNTNLKIILGLLCPLYIVRLEFKSREELQLMPQTEEEHMYGMDDEEAESVDSESLNSPKRNTADHDIEKPARLTVRRKSTMRSFSNKALISSDRDIRDTVVTENGKVSSIPQQASQGGATFSSGGSSDTFSQFYQFPYEYNFTDVKRNRPLKLKRRLYEFYTAPITKFWAHSMGYMVFLYIYSFVVLVKMSETPSWQELYVIAYICSLGCEKIREIVSSEPEQISHKFAVWSWNMWNPCDAVAILVFLLGLSLRLQQTSVEVGRVIYCIDIMYWYLRILNILGVNKYLGPLVTMMGKMIKNMIYFVVLLLVVLISFGVCRQAILHPHREASWTLAKEVVFQPYFMLYGEVFADQIDPECGEDPLVPCVTGRWIPPIVMSIYLLVANILLINLLIAVFNNIFIEVNAISHQVWMFQRFTVVMEYEQKPCLPPPLIVFCHIFLLLKFVYRRLRGLQDTYDNGLKLFLDRTELERLYDFEEECVEGYFREKESRLQASTDERIKTVSERVESMQQKIEDINQKENNQMLSIQGIEFRIRKLEELFDKNLSTLAVIHRFMAAHSNIGKNIAEGPLHDFHLVTTDPVFSAGGGGAAHSDVYSDVSSVKSGGGGPGNARRKILSRSLTEGRPSGAHLPDYLPSARMMHFRDQVILSDEEGEKTIEAEEEEESKPICEDGSPRPVDAPKQSERKKKTSFSLDFDDDGANANENFYSGCSSSVGCLIDGERGSRRDSDISGSQGSRRNMQERSITWGEPYIKVIPPPRSKILRTMHEYTSITDELESMCGLFTPPESPRLMKTGDECEGPRSRVRNASGMSNSEIAAFLEKQTLKHAEESDYQQMEDIIQKRFQKESTLSSGDAVKFDNNAFFMTGIEAGFGDTRPGRLLRSGAVEITSPVQEVSPDSENPDKTLSPDGTSTNGNNAKNVSPAASIR